MEYARDGLKQSFRARSAFFRVFLKWAFFMQRFNENHRMAIIVGLLVGYKILRVAAAVVHPLLVIPLALAYYLFVFGSWLSGGIANFLLLRDPVARLSLDREEKLEGLVIGGLFLGGLAGLVAGAAFSLHPLLVISGVMMIAALPASMVFTNSSGKGRFAFGGITTATLVLGAIMALDVAENPARKILDGTAAACFNGVVIMCAGSTWLGMVPALRRSKPG